MQLFAATRLNQRQGLAITVQLQQAIKLLQFNNMELAKYIEEQAQENPFIDLKMSEDAKKSLDGTITAIPEKAEQKVAIENQFETGDVHSPNKPPKHNSDTIPDISEYLASGEISLYSHVTNFAYNMFSETTDLRIAILLCEELDPSGWLTTNLEMIAQKVNSSLDRVDCVLRKLQTIEPTGLFARSLKECILLQLEEKNLLEDDILSVVDNLDQLAKGKLENLKKRFKIRDKRMIEIITTIRSLNPKPGSQFQFDEGPIISPDLKITGDENNWSVSLYSGNLPTVVVNKDYAKEAIKNSLENESKDFLKTHLSDANWLKRAIQQRNETTIKIGLSILKFQIDFFNKGPAFLGPLTLKEVSEDVGVHESTVSRVTSNSLIETPFGVLPLKIFFSSKIQSSSCEAQSGASIRHKIVQLIKSEDPRNPLSDEDIVENFAKIGIQIARRTVAKYRKIENIPSSFDRRKQAKLNGVLT